MKFNQAKIARAIGDLRALSTELNTADPLPATLDGIGRAGILDPWGRPYVYFRFPPSNGKAPPKGSIRMLRRLDSGRAVERSIPAAMVWSVLNELVNLDRANICIFAVRSWERVHCSEFVSPSTEARLREIAIAIDAHPIDARLARRKRSSRIAMSTCDSSLAVRSCDW